MKRILILGCCGAGKSTFARSLSDITDIDIIHLDKEYWNPGWVETPQKEWKEKVKKLVLGDSWIMDGNYASSLDIRLPRADTIIFLDRSAITCLYRVLKRIRKYRGQSRPDMIEGCYERFNIGFLHYVAIFNLKYRKKMLHKLSLINTTQNLHILKNGHNIQKFLDGAITNV